MPFLPKKRKHKLVVLGDSITQGFQSSAIYRTDFSFPAMLASALDPEFEFRQARFSVRGGIPINLEFILRTLERERREQLDWRRYPVAISEVYSSIRKTKQYWEGNPEALLRDEQAPYHNQSVWGLNISDVWNITDSISRDYIENSTVKYSVFNFLPDHALYTTARCILNPSGEKKRTHKSMLDNIAELADDGGIENLIIHLGSNHIVGAITKLDLIWSEASEIEMLPFQRKYTVLRPEHFKANYESLASSISRLNVKNVIVATIPYVTTPPVIQGISGDSEDQNFIYQDYYTHFWQNKEEFTPDLHRHLTKDQAIQLDIAVDEFNQIIKETADKMGWILVDVNRAVTLMDYRRHKGRQATLFPQGLHDALKIFPETSYLGGLHQKCFLDTRYLEADTETNRIISGGIFSLDGLHPTTIGYGLIADVFYQEMKSSGIRFQSELNWPKIVENDSLIMNPPLFLHELKGIYRLFAGMYNSARALSDPDKIVEPLFGFWRNLRKVLTKEEME